MSKPARTTFDPSQQPPSLTLIFGVGVAAIAVAATLALILMLGRIELQLADTATRTAMLGRCPGTSLGVWFWGITGLFFSAFLGIALVALWGAARYQRRLRLFTESRERNRAMVDNLVEAVLHIDEQGRLLALNTAAQQLFGYRSPQLRGKSLTTLFPDSHREPAALLGHRRAQATARDGSKLLVALAVSKVEIGSYPVYTALVHDLTELQQQLAALEQARDAADRRGRAADELLAVLSYEARTPMNDVLGALELLDDTATGDAQRELIATAERSASTLFSVINDIGDLCGIESGRLALHAIDFDLRDTLRDVTALFEAIIAQRGLTLTYSIDADCPQEVCGDPVRLRQILIALLTNALRLTDAGEVQLRVQVQSQAGDAVVLRFAVADSGGGIDAALRAQLFRPFATGDTAVSRQLKGSGLGLVIAKRLVELMGGAIGLESRTGVGSVFWFRLRLGQVRTPEAASSTDLFGMRTLVVSPDVASRLLIEEDLQGRGSVVAAVADRDAARAAAIAGYRHGQPFTLAIIDHLPPALDALALAGDHGGDSRLAGIRMLVSGVDELAEPPSAASATMLALPSAQRGARLNQAIDRLLALPDRGTDAPAAVAETATMRGRVLLVEDNPTNQRIAQLMLERLGLEVEIARDGAEALAVFIARPAVLVLMDVQLPRMGGYEATRRIRAEEGAGAHVPIIALSAATLPQDIQACADAGMDDWIGKPLSQKALRRMLAAWLPLGAIPAPGSGIADPGRSPDPGAA